MQCFTVVILIPNSVSMRIEGNCNINLKNCYVQKPFSYKFMHYILAHQLKIVLLILPKHAQIMKVVFFLKGQLIH